MKDLYAHFDSKYSKMNFVQCYTPTTNAEEHTKEDLYEQLQSTITLVPRHDLIMGDINVKVGRNGGKELHGKTKYWRDFLQTFVLKTSQSKWELWFNTKICICRYGRHQMK